MKCLLIAVSAVAIFLGSQGSAEEQPGIPEEIVKELNGLVGTWEVEGKIGGKEQTGSFTIRWAQTLDKRKCCLIGRGLYEMDGKTRSVVSLLGWNAAKKCIEDRGFDANGGNGVLYWTVKSPTEWQGEVVMVEDGKEVKSEAVLIKKGSSEVVMESESENGEASRWVFYKVRQERKKKAKE